MTLPDPASSPDWTQQVCHALAGLGDDQHAFLRLIYANGLTQHKIAERYGLPVASVSRTVALALRNLASSLELGRPIDLGASLGVA
jgi:RNA polymerase sigma factor (sigma-70 family)